MRKLCFSARQNVSVELEIILYIEQSGANIEQISLTASLMPLSMHYECSMYLLKTLIVLPFHDIIKIINFLHYWPKKAKKVNIWHDK
jgi:hypothetical protein